MILCLAVAAAAWAVSVGLHGAPLFLQAGQRPAAGVQALPLGEGAQILRQKCFACHGPELIVEQRLSRDAWSRELEKMTGWGAAVDGAERGALLDYLSSNFGDPPLARAAGSPESPGAGIVAKRCLGCHDASLIAQQRLTPAGWAREVDKMIGWGASVADPEKSLLIEHLAALPVPASMP